MISQLDLNVVTAGTMMTLLVTGPAVLILSSVDDSADTSVWVLALYLMILAGFLLGGALAGRQHPTTAFAHGAASTVTAFIIVQGIIVIQKIADGQGVSIGALLFNALLAASIGIIGAWFGARRGTLDNGGGEPTR